MAAASLEADAGPSAGREEIAMRRPSKRQLVAAGLVTAGLVLAGGLPAVVIRAQTADLRFADPDRVPARPVGLVLGAGLQPDGSLSWMLERRIELAARLYRAGRVRALLMSGDHSTVDHDEVDAMSRAAQALGVPAAAIVTDHAGFDTFSSCYRARHVFGVRRAVVVTQGWHLPRAVWLCRQQGMDVVGVESAGHAGTPDTYGAVREIPADVKSMIDVWAGREPTFTGPVEHSLDTVNAAR
jgi:vancomycin permeability regulator SanA